MSTAETVPGGSNRVDKDAAAPAQSVGAFGRETGLLLEATRSIVHDTRNRLTGLSLCMSAWSRSIRPGRAGSDGDLAMLERTLASLEGLCGEFAGIETAISFEANTVPAAQLAYSYAAFLERLGFEVTSVDVGPGFDLTRGTRGVLARALVHLSWALHKHRARRIRVSAERNEGATFSVRFAAEGSTEAIGTNEAFRAARDLVESAGGSFCADNGATEARIMISFAQPLERFNGRSM